MANGEALARTQLRGVANLPKIRNRTGGIRTQDLSTDRLFSNPPY